MRGVAREKRAIHAIVRDAALVDGKSRLPLRTDDADIRAAAAVDRRLKIGERRFGLVCLVVKGDDDAPNAIGETADEDDVAVAQIEPQLVARNVRAFELQIAEKERVRDGVPFEIDAEKVADGAVRAVAAGDPVESLGRVRRSFAREFRIDAGGVLMESGERHTALDAAAERRKMIDEQPFGLVLREREQKCETARDTIERKIGDMLPRAVDRDPVQRPPTRYRGIGNTVAIELFERARLHDQRLRPARGVHRTIDQPVGNAQPCKLDRKR